MDINNVFVVVIPYKLIVSIINFSTVSYVSEFAASVCNM